MSRSLRLVPSDPAWPAQYARLAAEIRAALGAVLLDVQHVGSTAVPGLLSKPVIDIAIAVASERDAGVCVAPLVALGYQHRGPHGDDPQRRYFVRDAGGVRIVQVHLYMLPAVAWDALLTFRDALRAHAHLAAAYTSEKLRVAERVQWNKAEYAIAKGPFVRRALVTSERLLHEQSATLTDEAYTTESSVSPRDLR